LKQPRDILFEKWAVTPFQNLLSGRRGDTRAPSPSKVFGSYGTVCANARTLFCRVLALAGCLICFSGFAPDYINLGATRHFFERHAPERDSPRLIGVDHEESVDSRDSMFRTTKDNSSPQHAFVSNITSIAMHQGNQVAGSSRFYVVAFYVSLFVLVVVVGWGVLLLREWLRRGESLAESEARANLLCELGSEALLELDGTGRIVRLNPVAQSLLDVDEGDALPVHFSKLIRRKDRILFAEKIQFAKKGKPAEAILSLNEAISGLSKLHITLRAIGNSGILIRFRPANMQEENAGGPQKEKPIGSVNKHHYSGFMAFLSHEMRTQLTSILGFSAVLTEELEGQQEEAASLIERSGKRLLSTVNAMLDLSRIEAGGFMLEPEEVDVTAEVAEEIQLLLRLATEKGLGLHLRQPVTPVILRTDRAAFRRILENLVSNAIKFTDDGKIVVEMKTDEERFFLSVKDTGRGISSAFLPYLFDAFKRESSGMASSHKGTGLGLSITHRLVKMMGGRIMVRSKLGSGTQFVVILPRRLKLKV